MHETLITLTRNALDNRYLLIITKIDRRGSELFTQTDANMIRVASMVHGSLDVRLVLSLDSISMLLAREARRKEGVNILIFGIKQSGVNLDIFCS